MEQPVLIGRFRLSPEFFVKTRLASRCRGECARACCDEGAWLTLYEARRIIEHADEIQPYLQQPLDFQAWDLSRPAYLYTALVDKGTPHQRCWFLTQERRCAIHSFALDQNLALNSIKPFFCMLFPLTLVDIDINVTEIALDAKAYETCLVEGEKETWLYTQFESDLRRVLGDEVYAEMQRLFPE
jgi:Fe-S-cluster containining protein